MNRASPIRFRNVSTRRLTEEDTVVPAITTLELAGHANDAAVHG